MPIACSIGKLTWFNLSIDKRGRKYSTWNVDGKCRQCLATHLGYSPMIWRNNQSWPYFISHTGSYRFLNFCGHDTMISCITWPRTGFICLKYEIASETLDFHVDRLPDNHYPNYPIDRTPSLWYVHPFEWLSTIIKGGPCQEAGFRTMQRENVIDGGKTQKKESFPRYGSPENVKAVQLDRLSLGLQVRRKPHSICI